MAKTEQDLKQLFRNNADNTSIYEAGNMITNIPSMTEDKFIEVLSSLLTEREANKANSEENQHLKPLERLKKYNIDFPELSEAEKLANIKKWLGKELIDGMESLLEAKATLPINIISGSLLPDMELEEAEILSRECDYACFAVEEDDNEINTADASAFFLEGYLEAQNRLNAMTASVWWYD